ncbi:hypothetical protein QFC19_006713 [Naganishia cerealis]|uniref:Uncharacterized protein n=1 Tax=Naganishia cerealis TaxID=610337 RepID=A0ACC2VDR1_9TREE|nr:hypothetical protein QFC19_006713 [Naganishia cerealis]
MAQPPPSDPGAQPRALSTSFSRPGSTIDDLMARFSSPNPNPAPPAMSSPFSAAHHHGNGSAISPPPGIAGYAPSMFSPAMGLAGMMPPAMHGGPAPYGSLNGAAAPGTQAGEGRQSQLLDLLRNAGQTPVLPPPTAPAFSQTPSSSHLYQQFGLGNGQPPQLTQHQSYSHPHPAMQHNNSFSGLPSTGLNRVVSPTQGLSAGAGTNQAQNLLAALINGSSTPVPPAPAQQESPFSISQPVIVDQQAPPPAEQPSGIARADTFGNLPKTTTSDPTDTTTTDLPASARSPSPVAKVEEHAQTSTTITSVPASETTTGLTNAATEPPKTTLFSSFVSPFDAFDSAPTFVSGAEGPSSKKKNKKDKPVKVADKTDRAVSADAKGIKAAPSKQVSESTEDKAKATKASVPAPASTGKSQSIASSNANSLPSAKKPTKQDDIPVVYRSSAFIDTSRTITAGTIPSAEYLYDMSESHIDSLVHIAKPYEERRISNIKTQVMATGLSNGSVLKASEKLLAYVLPKGKARVVNQDTAENTLISLPLSSDNSQPAIVDMALTDEWVVLLGEDGSFGVWRVDTGPNGQSLKCDFNSYQCPPSGSKAPTVKRIHLAQGVAGATLWLMSDEEIFWVNMEIFVDQEDNWLDYTEGHVPSSHTGLVDFDISSRGIPYEKQRIAAVTRSGNFVVFSSDTEQPVIHGVHRPADGTWVTSIRILGENVLIGSSEGEFDLVAVQASTSGSVAPILSKLIFKDHIKSINPEQALWMKPRVNAKEHLLWIVSFARASVFAIKYRDIKITDHKQRAFTTILEFPLEPLGDFALDPCDPASFFFKDPKGFSQASVPKHLLALLEDSDEEDFDESDEVEEPVAEPANKREVGQDRVELNLIKDDTDIIKSAKALDNNAADAISQDAESAQLPQSLTANKDLAMNKPGSGIVDTDEARQESAFRTQPSTANPDTVEHENNLSSNTAAFDLSMIQSSIADAMKESMTSQLSSFSAAQLNEVRAIRHDLVTQETERQQTLVTLINDVIERDVKNSLQQIISNQIDKKVIPLVAETLRQQTANAFSSQIPAQINSALQDTVLSQVERSLIPHLGRTFTATLSPIVERNVRALISDNLIPRFVESVDSISDELSTAIHREMLEVRKDVLVEQSTQLKSAEAMIQSMAASMKTLIGQVSDLSDQVKELKALQAQAQMQSRGSRASFTLQESMPQPSASGPAPLPPISTPQTLPTASQQHSVVAPRPVGIAGPLAQTNVPNVPPPATRSDSSLAGAEEEFLNALMTMSDAELIGFIMSKSDKTQVYLPAPGQQPSPLSQQVLLTMIHRLTKAMTPLPTATVEYQTLLQWIHRTAYLIDGKQPDIRDFFEPVKRALTSDYQALIDRYAQQNDRTPATVHAVQAMVQIVQILASK